MTDRSRRPILLVDDSDDDAELAILALRQVGILRTIDVARDGEEALRYLLGGGEGPTVLPAVVLLDLKLPKVGGFEVLERVRRDARTRYLPIVVLSSSDAREDIEQSYALGANSFVRKPVDSSRYAAAMGQVGSYWLNINESPD